MKPALVVKDARELALDGESLTSLMRDVLMKGRPFRFRARGWSMSPFIKDGDTVTVRPLRPSEPASGDVVAFLFPATGKAAVHRVVKVEGGRFVVKGDNVAEGDGEVGRESILGIVSGVERDGRRVKLGRERGLGGALVAGLSRTGVLAGGLKAVRGILKPRGKRSSEKPEHEGAAAAESPGLSVTVEKGRARHGSEKGR